MQFQLYSDLHTELIKKKMRFETLAEILILAGDIGSLTSNTFKPFIDEVSKKWKYVVYVPGNHEYYIKTHSITELQRLYMEFFSQYDNVHYLDNDTWEYGEYLFVGSTLWSKPQNISELNDFHYIQENNRLFTSKSNKKKVKKLVKLQRDTFWTMHDDSVEWIKYILNDNNSKNENDRKKVIMVTHFPPINENVSNPKYKDCPLRDYFTNDFNTLGISLDNIKLWISGHTHYSHDFVKDDVRFLSNQLGYIDEIQTESGVDVDGLFMLE